MDPLDAINNSNDGSDNIENEQDLSENLEQTIRTDSNDELSSADYCNKDIHDGNVSENEPNAIDVILDSCAQTHTESDIQSQIPNDSEMKIDDEDCNSNYSSEIANESNRLETNIIHSTIERFEPQFMKELNECTSPDNKTIQTDESIAKDIEKELESCSIAENNLEGDNVINVDNKAVASKTDEAPNEDDIQTDLLEVQSQEESSNCAKKEEHVTPEYRKALKQVEESSLQIENALNETDVHHVGIIQIDVEGVSNKMDNIQDVEETHSDDEISSEEVVQTCDKIKKKYDEATELCSEINKTCEKVKQTSHEVQIHCGVEKEMHNIVELEHDEVKKVSETDNVIKVQNDMKEVCDDFKKTQIEEVDNSISEEDCVDVEKTPDNIGDEKSQEIEIHVHTKIPNEQNEGQNEEAEVKDNIHQVQDNVDEIQFICKETLKFEELHSKENEAVINTKINSKTREMESDKKETQLEISETQNQIIGSHNLHLEKDEMQIEDLDQTEKENELNDCSNIVIESDYEVTLSDMNEKNTQIENEAMDIECAETHKSDVDMKTTMLQKNNKSTVGTCEEGNSNNLVETDSTLRITNLMTEYSNTGEQQIDDCSTLDKICDNENRHDEQSSLTTENRLNEKNLDTIDECERIKKYVPNESGTNTAINFDKGNSLTGVKNTETFSEKINDCTDQSSIIVNEELLEDSSNDVIENTIGTSSNINPGNEENIENTVFVHVGSRSEKSVKGKSNKVTLSDNQDEYFQESQPQVDPIASDDSALVPIEDDVEEIDQCADDQSNYEQPDEEQGASEEMCIIPDTERVISQAEKDAAANMVPLCDPAEFECSDPSSDGTTAEITERRKSSNPENFIVSLYMDENVNACMQCCLPRKSKYSVLHNNLIMHLCDDGCLNNFKRRHGDKVIMDSDEDLQKKKLTCGINNDNMVTKVKSHRKCSECQKIILLNEIHLSWETMEFCNELCLLKYQKKVASNCSNCQITVRNNCLGKYCVRFGHDIRQFCSGMCLEEYKKALKVCSYCQKDMSSGGSDGFLAPVGDKGQFKDFCTQICMEKYDVMSNNRRTVKSKSQCSVCRKEKPVRVQYEHNGKINFICGEPCFVAFKFVNNITPAKCNMCKKYFDNKILEEHSMYDDNISLSFCSKICQNIYIIRHRKIIPCSWCKVKKYNFDMIKRSSSTSSSLLMCSLNCLSLYQVSINAVHSKKTVCDHCQKSLQALYHLTMSDATMRNFCSYACVMAFQNQFPKSPITLNEPEELPVPVPTGGPKRSKRAMTNKRSKTAQAEVPTIPVISSVQSLAATNGPTMGTLRTKSSKVNSDSSVIAPPPVVKTQIKQHFIIKPVPTPPQRNIGTLCKVNMQTKGINFKPITCNKEVQTDEIQEKTALIPIPVPIYVPAPMWMYSMPFPVPFPFPLPVPVPIFIPTTRNSANGIMKEIKKIQVKIPTDPFEAELLMMAEMVAGDKKEEHTDSESEEEDPAPPPDETTFSPEPVDASNTFGDDMLQMALKMATELDEPAVDLEGALTANTITASQGTEPAAVEEPSEEPQPIHHHIMERQVIRGRKRPGRPPKTGGAISKRGRRSSNQMEIPIMAPPQPPPPPEPVEKPDANMCLKYTFGVNAWKQWVTTKNTELEKTSRRVKLFKPEILQLTADELNYSLCLFVKEVRKPNGQEYAPDTIYYLCLGIQQYLFENARIDNIFCDSYYEKFTDCLDEVAKKFSILYNDSHYIVTRVEEEHLWESKQLGAHSPHVLLSTLMFFNTKHFNLTTVDEHMQLSFSHIMKHWKRNSNAQPGNAKTAGSRNVLLRFYPPQSNGADTSQKKKKVYEQQENEDNPLRCPVKLYEFYLSKCPESVKTRNDVFYLLPERSCVPDSPVWYSTMPLPKAALEKMLHRVKMVKEINVALLTS